MGVRASRHGSEHKREECDARDVCTSVFEGSWRGLTAHHKGQEAQVVFKGVQGVISALDDAQLLQHHEQIQSRDCTRSAACGLNTTSTVLYPRSCCV